MNDNLSAISPEERTLREEAHRYARGSVQLEGFKLSAADEAHARRFIGGEIDLAQFVALRPLLEEESQFREANLDSINKNT